MRLPYGTNLDILTEEWMHRGSTHFWHSVPSPTQLSGYLEFGIEEIIMAGFTALKPRYTYIIESETDVDTLYSWYRIGFQNAAISLREYLIRRLNEQDRPTLLPNAGLLPAY